MKEEYFKLKQDIRKLLHEAVMLYDFRAAEGLYYDVAEISYEDCLEVAFDIIYKEGGKDEVYIEETFLENVYETFHTSGNETNIKSLKERIKNNKEKPAVNIIFKQMLDLSDLRRDVLYNQLSYVCHGL